MSAQNLNQTNPDEGLKRKGNFAHSSTAQGPEETFEQRMRNQEKKTGEENERGPRFRARKRWHQGFVQSRSEAEKSSSESDTEEPKEIAQEPTSEIPKLMETSEKGLTSDEVKARSKHQGLAVIEEIKQSPLRQFFRFLWNPLAWLLELGALTFAIIGDWLDFGFIVGLLLLNATLGLYEEWCIISDLETLNERTATKTTVKRDGQWKEVDSRELVSGDVIQLKKGDTIPIDCKVIEADNLRVDQFAFTGQLFAVEKKPGSTVFSGSQIEQGKFIGVASSQGSLLFGKSVETISTYDPLTRST